MVSSPIQYYLRCLNPLEVKRGEKPRYVIVLVKDSPVHKKDGEPYLASRVRKSRSKFCTNLQSKDHCIPNTINSTARITRSKYREFGKECINNEHSENPGENNERIDILNNNCHEVCNARQISNITRVYKSSILQKPDILETRNSKNNCGGLGILTDGRTKIADVPSKLTKAKNCEKKVKNWCASINSRCCTKVGEDMMGRTRLQTAHKKAGLLKNCLRNSKFILRNAIDNIPDNKQNKSKQLILKCIRGRCDCYQEDCHQTKKICTSLVKKQEKKRAGRTVMSYLNKNKVKLAKQNIFDENAKPKLSVSKRLEAKKLSSSKKNKKVFSEANFIDVSDFSSSHLPLTDTSSNENSVNRVDVLADHNQDLFHATNCVFETVQSQAANNKTCSNSFENPSSLASPLQEPVEHVPQANLTCHTVNPILEDSEKALIPFLTPSTLIMAENIKNRTGKFPNKQSTRFPETSANPHDKELCKTDPQDTLPYKVQCSRGNLETNRVITEGHLLGGKYKYRILRGISKVQRPLICFCCGMQMCTHLHLKDHLNSLHPHRCKPCSKAFDSLLELEYHRTVVHMKVRHKCSLCNQIFSTGSHYDKHCKSYLHLRNVYLLEQGMKIILKECFNCNFKSNLPLDFQLRQNKMSQFWQEKLSDDDDNRMLVVHKVPQLQFMKDVMKSQNLLDSSFMSKLEKMFDQVQQFENSSSVPEVTESSSLHLTLESDASKPKPVIAVIEPTIRAAKCSETKPATADFKKTPQSSDSMPNKNKSSGSDQRKITLEKHKHSSNLLDFLDNISFKSVTSNTTPASSSASSSDATILWIPNKGEKNVAKSSSSQLPHASRLSTPCNLNLTSPSQNHLNSTRASSTWSLDDCPVFSSVGNSCGTGHHRNSLEIFKAEFDRMWDQYSNE